MPSHLLKMPITGLGTLNDPRRPKYSNLFDGPWSMVDGGTTCLVYCNISGAALGAILANVDAALAQAGDRHLIEDFQPDLKGRPIRLGFGNDVGEL